jgi:hypothetical protein
MNIRWMYRLVLPEINNLITMSYVSHSFHLSTVLPGGKLYSNINTFQEWAAKSVK